MGADKGIYDVLISEEKIEEIKKDKNYLHYHLMPPVGWLSDPNGLCHFKGVHHIYYQYSPTDVHGGLKYWGHYVTKDFIHYRIEKTAFFPDTKYDRDGVYSGSAFVDRDCIYYFYTGNVKYQGNYDYINVGRESNLIMVTSKDGFIFSDKVCMLKNTEYPNDVTLHVRDPKIYKENDTYYLVLGARTKDDKGCVLLFESSNLMDWKYYQRIQTKETFGYMWECPDIFWLDTKKILITCPQGVPTVGIKYENIYQNGYFIVTDTTVGEFTVLDYGSDFYAPQTYQDDDNRRIMIGWMGMPDASYTNPTVHNGWQHALTIPRLLTIRDDHICQEPIKELQKLRGNIFTIDKKATLLNNVFELNIKFNSNQNQFQLKLRTDVTLTYQNNIFELSLGKSGYGRDSRHAFDNELKNISVYSDTSSLEIFINDGKTVFTTRVYDENTSIEVSSQEQIDIDGYYLTNFKYDSII